MRVVQDCGCAGRNGRNRATGGTVRCARRHARPVGDYVAEFTSGLPKGLDGRVAFSCNCILNYLHSGLEGRKTGGIVGPITFGEIAYQLLNQTMVYVTVEDAAR